MTNHEKNIVAHHEAGHALMGYLLKDCTPPLKVSIIPRGVDALGFSQQEPEEKKLYNRDELLSKVSVLYAGRVAEEIIFDSITTGQVMILKSQLYLFNDYNLWFKKLLIKLF